MIWLVGINYKSLEWPNGLARATRQSVRVAVRIPMSRRVAILGVILLPSLRRNLFFFSPRSPPPRPTRAVKSTKTPPISLQSVVRACWLYELSYTRFGGFMTGTPQRFRRSVRLPVP
jgi:hypothetical protein